MRRQIGSVISVIAVVLYLLICRIDCRASIYVPDQYATIQEAVDASGPGEDIIVRGGVYVENVTIPSGKDGLSLESESGVTMTFIRAYDPAEHVLTITADNVTVNGFDIYGALDQSDGIRLSHANGCSIRNCLIRDNQNGIQNYESDHLTCSDTEVRNNLLRSFALNMADYCILTRNTITADRDAYGLSLSNCQYCTLNDNEISGTGSNLTIWGYLETQTVTQDNTVDGRTVYYMLGLSGVEVPADAGYVALINCTNMTVKDLALTYVGCGVLFYYTTHSSITNVTVQNSGYGAAVYYSNDIAISNCRVDNCEHTIALANTDGCSVQQCLITSGIGISVDTCTNTIVSQNQCREISVEKSDICTLSSNEVSGGYGISVEDSTGITIASNKASNGFCGLAFGDNESSGITLTSNDLSQNTCNLRIGGDYSMWTVDTSNQVNGNPVYYWKNKHDETVPAGAGYLALIDCSNINVNNQILSYNDNGLLIDGCTDCFITNTELSHNVNAGLLINESTGIFVNHCIVNNNRYTDNLGYGLYLTDCTDSVFSENQVRDNSKYGIFEIRCTNNQFYLNDITGATSPIVYSVYCSNTWNTPEKMEYTYSGSTFEGFMGNYFSDYTGIDEDGNGIGDSPYTMTGDNGDAFPLMMPAATYTGGELVLRLRTNRTVYTGDELLTLDLELINSTENSYETLLFIALWIDINGDGIPDGDEFFYYPTFSSSPSGMGPFTCYAGLSIPMMTIFEMMLPPGPLPALNCAWYGVLLDAESMNLITDLASAAFRFE